MPTPFDLLTLQKAENRLTNVQDADLKANAQFFDGDHWQNGLAWVGPLPATNEPSFALALARVKKVFTSRNVIKEVVQRQTGAVVGVAPTWGVVPRRTMKADEKPTIDEQKEIDEVEGWLTDWWDSRKAHAYLQKITETAQHQCRGIMRLYVPRGELQTTDETDTATNGARITRPVTRVPAGPIPEQLARIYPDAPKLGSAAIVEDSTTKQKAGILVYEQTDADGNAPRKIAEVTYLDGDKTVIRELTENTDRKLALDFGKRLPMYEVEQPQLITEQVRQQQRALNLALTTIPHNVTTADWLERIITNGQAPGDFDYDEAGKAIPGTWKAKPFYTGPSTTNWIRGIATQNEETGKTELTTPSVVFRDPVGIETSKDAVSEHYLGILSECDQAHTVLAGEAMPSGKSREASRKDFNNRTRKTTAEVEPGTSWLLETALAMAEAFAGTPGKYTKRYRVVAECRVNTDALDATEIAADETSVEKGFLSRESAMERRGVVDVDGENIRIAADPVNRLALRKRQGEALQSLVTAGASLAGAAKLIGMTPQEIADLTSVETFSTDPNATENDNPDEPPADIPATEGDNIPGDNGSVTGAEATRTITRTGARATAA